MPFLYLDLQKDQENNGEKIHQQRIFYSDTIHGTDILLFVHGWFLDSSIFTPYITDLQKNYRIISFDLPGHGKSSQEKNHEYNLLIAFRALKELVNMLSKDSNSITLVGFSVGSFLSLKLSLFYPKLVDQLILISPLVTLNSFEKDIAVLEKLDSPFFTIALFMRALFLQFPFNELVQDQYPLHNINFFKRIKKFQILRKTHSTDAAIQYIFGFHNVSIESLIKNNNKPTLLIYGTQDPFISKESLAEYTRNMSHARLTNFDNASHNILQTHPKEILHLIDDFLKNTHKQKYGWLKLFSNQKSE